MGSFFQAFGFQEVGAVSFRTLSGGSLSLHWQTWRGRGAEDWVVGVLRLGYCLPFLGTPHVPLFPSQCLFPAPSPSQGLFWSISPWSWFPRLLWSLLHSLLQASTAFCSWCCRPRGHGVRSSPSPISFSLWTCHTFSWGPFRLCSCR